MPAIYLSFEIDRGMTIEQKQERLYLGEISAGEQAYTLGAALAECRKKLESLDALVVRLRNDFQTLKREVRREYLFEELLRAVYYWQCCRDNRSEGLGPIVGELDWACEILTIREEIYQLEKKWKVT